MKTIIVGQPFRLPHVGIDGFKHLVKALTYESPNFILQEGMEIQAAKVLGKYFTGFEIVRKCPECGLNTEILGQMDITIYEVHMEMHQQQKAEEFKIFADYNCWIGYGHPYRRCLWCSGKIKGIAIGFYTIQFRCRICGKWQSKQWRTWELSEVMCDLISLGKKLRGFRELFSSPSLTSIIEVKG